ncbi:MULTISPECIES: MMPL family transporter [Shewanella]|jgi:predicted RND superfamily exporter protein|uniref:efflux RND transporter permease subunit n=1 Tax=Shewanella TaxID=22 RepID=UPI000C44B4D3|nr:MULTISPECIES: MMPL family transporter [Shewanella]NCQ43701.1 RND family transporter [Shewanella frigidimarina]NCO70075.1 RND family transporter [Shewanella vesiculosa]NCP35615.1 RND family transporter [Shewanella vesiculosa]NCP68196.1 RND family transporter [Shewanella vesiculosa]NCP72844.1 RND family transporter [Shewanella vesiculosa]
MLEKLVNGFESHLFRNRKWVIISFIFITIFLGYQASQLKMDAAFSKNIPLNHSYMQTYTKHQKDFGGANSIMVAVEDTSGNIFNPEFFDALKNVHDQLFFIPGVERSQVKSLFSPSTRFTEVVEDGFAGGPVIPADFSNDEYGLKVVRDNIEKAGIVGRLIGNDYTSAMVSAQLMEFDPQTGEAIDTIAFANQLEQELRGKFETDKIKIHIIGFAKMAGDVAEGAKGVLLFFLIAIAITAVMVYLFSKSIVLTILPLMCSLVAVFWQLGLLTVIGFGLDPMSILVPFLVFAIGVSHGVQMINAVRRRVLDGQTTKAASASAFRSLLVPGGVALLSDTVGFLTLLSIDIGIIRELAISASLGVAVIILTNLILLPLVISYFELPTKQDNLQKRQQIENIWRWLSKFATPKYAVVVLISTAILYAVGFQQASKMQIGDLQGGAPALHQDSRYNQDTFFITKHFSITTDVMSVIVEATPEACTYHSVLSQIDQFEWMMANTPGVESTASLASIAKKVNAGFNEGNPKWEILPRTTASLVQAVGQVPTTSGLLNSNCSVMPVYLFLKDHKAETIEVVVDKVKAVAAELNSDTLQFKLASGPVGVMAATNEAVSEAQLPMMLYVYGAVFVLCLISFKSLKATIAVIIPLYVVSTLAQALMTLLDIGLAVSTLPVIALGVGIGVDYGIYILSTMSNKLSNGMPVQQAYFEALVERGSAVIFTGLTLAIGVSTWFFSDLKFQMDMGILLTFMFLVNMLGAIIILPALSAMFWRKK